MASSPEQEIPQEIVERAYSAWYASEQKEGATVWNSMCVALATVLPDLQRPLLEEIERLKQDLHTAVKRIGRLGKEIANLEEQRDARPDLTDDEKQVVIEALDPTQWKPPYDGVTRSARANLERSLDV